MSKKRPQVFLDSNVLIEALFEERHPAGAVISLALAKQIQLVTCQQVLDDVEAEILDRCSEANDSALIDTWDQFKNSLNMSIEPDATDDEFKESYNLYLPVMRHVADIPILAVALRCKPAIILSGNREHFNDKVEERCGIPIRSCKEFFAQLITQELKLLV